MEQRRSQRRDCQLRVEVTEGQHHFEAETHNVSRHGIFVRTATDLRERFLVQLSLHLPDGPMGATGFVARTSSEREPQGVGIQFFALSAASKSRWDRFVHNELGAGPEPGPAEGNPSRATFLVKLRDRARLEEFAARNFVKGGLYMATPVIKGEGAPVALVVVHPESEDEYVIEGEVARVCREPPKGMDIRFSVPDAEEQAEFLEFVRTGEAPPRSEPVSPAISPSANRAPVPMPPPPAPPITGDFSVDIEVDESALDDSTRFSWEDVSDYRMVLDFELTSDAATADIAGSIENHPMEVTLEVERPAGLRSDADQTIERLAPPELVARAKPTGDYGAPGGPSAPTSPASPSGDIGARDPAAPPNRRNSWTWPTPPHGIDPVGPNPVPTTTPYPPPRFPPPRNPSIVPTAGPSPVPTAPSSPSSPPEVLDLGMKKSSALQEELQIPMLDPVGFEEVADVPMLPPEEADASWIESTPLPGASVRPAPEVVGGAGPASVAAPATRPEPRAGPPREDLEPTPDLSVVPEPASPTPPGSGEYDVAIAPEEPGRLATRVPGLEAEAAPSDSPELGVDPIWREVLEAHCAPRRRIAVRCDGCDTELGEATLGRAPGPLGLVGEFKPYWNPDLQRLVAVLRLRRSEERNAVKDALQDRGAEVPVAALFEVAELNRPPADPATGARVRVNALVKSLLRVQDDLTAGARLDLPSARCPRCKENRLVAKVHRAP